MLRSLRSVALAAPLVALVSPAQAAPEMFSASFVFHAWGNDISSATTYPYSANDWTAAPLGYNCQNPSPYTYNGVPNPHCSPTKMRRGHPATGVWTAYIGTGVPPRITLQQSDFGVALGLKTAGNTWGVGNCCRAFLPRTNPYLQSFTYATFANAAGSFFAGGGAAAGAGYVNKTGMTGMSAGTWRIRAGVNAFGGVMGLLGKYGATGRYTIVGKTGTYSGRSSWNMVKAIGRPWKGTKIGSGTMGTLLYQNPYTKTNKWYKNTPMGGVKVNTITAIGTGTLWTTGQVGNFAKTGTYYTSLYRTGFDNRTPGGKGNIQLVTPTLTHWLSLDWWDTNSAQIGLLTIQVPEPGVTLLFAAGAGALGALVWLRHVSRRH